MYDKTIKLSNGIDVPVLALGTWLIDDDFVSDAVRQAVKIGYRHIDTAQAYGNERGVGEGIRTCSVDRSKMFVVSKVAAEHKTYEQAAKGIENTLKIMNIDYLDMMIIHSPQPWMEVNQSENRYVEGNRQAWKALEDSYKAGKIKAIGVSNFLQGDIESLLETAEIKPMVNQVLCHISNTPMSLIKYCQEKGIVMMKNNIIGDMAKKYNVSIPQLCIRYDIQLGMIVLPKTENPEHMKSYVDVDFEISKEDMEELINIEKIKNYGEHGFFPVFGGKL